MMTRRTTRAENRSVVDLFAGCGGLSLGLENAGFHPILVNELADEARESYLVNRAGEDFEHFQECRVDDPENPWVWKDIVQLRHHLETDIGKFKERMRAAHDVDLDAGELDLVVGGPPCQGYSGIGHRRSYAVDKRHIPSNHLYHHMIAVVSMMRPRMFLFENVRGLLSARWSRDDSGSRKGDIWLSVRRDFRDVLGDRYHMGWHLVRAFEYGVPQNRPRVLLVGISKDLGWTIKSRSLDDDGLLLHDEVHRAGGLIPAPGVQPPTLDELLSDLVDDVYVNGGSTDTYPKRVHSSIARWLRTPREGGTALRKGQPLTEHQYSRHKERIVSKYQYMIDHDGEIHPSHRTKKFSQRVLQREWQNGKPNITATSLPDDYVHFSQPRSLTVREWARIQMFPDWYQFKGKRTTGGIRRAGNPRTDLFEREVPKYTQIGNAVPVKLAEALGNHFVALLKSCES